MASLRLGDEQICRCQGAPCWCFIYGPGDCRSPAAITTRGNAYDEASIVKLLDRFKLKGPNGHHICLVLELQGPSIERLHGIKIRPRITSVLAKQLCHAIKFLHQSDVAFGDLSTANILLGMVDLNNTSARELREKLGEPMKEPVCHLQAEVYRQNAPQIVYRAVDFSSLDLGLLEPRIALTDLNEAVHTSDDTSYYHTGIHMSYASPEYILGINQRHTKASDIWALASCFYAMRSGRPLLPPSQSAPEHVALNIQHLMGPLPDHLYTRRPEDSEIAQLTDDILATSQLTLKHKLEEIGNWNPWHTMTRDERWENLQWYARDREIDPEDPEHDLRSRLDVGPPPPAQLSEEEFADLYDLLSRMLRYVPGERLSIEEVLAHPWLNREYIDNDDPSAPWIQRYDAHGEKYEGPKAYHFDDEEDEEEGGASGPPEGWLDDVADEDEGD